jgi:hypothetical protein
MLPTLSRRILRPMLLAAVMFFANAANASFHLWIIDQLYSDASGTAQYIELSTAASGQQFVAGMTISTSQGANTHAFSFLTDLPGDTTNHKFLIATQGFANLGVVMPDYVVPNGFLFLPNGIVNYASVDFAVYNSLPTDGIHAIDRNGNVVVNSPTNFAGVSGSVGSTTPPATTCTQATVYRYRNTQILGHFYTTSMTDGAARIAAGEPLVLEGAAFNACSGGSTSNGIYPVEIFKHLLVPGVYFYSLLPQEIASVRANLGNILQDQGIAFYALNFQPAGSFPVYRFRNTAVAGANFYTILEAEKGSIIANVPGYAFEGIGFWAMPPQITAPPPPSLYGM